MKILIVDDSAEDRYTVIRLLNNLYREVEISEAADVNKGLEFARTSTFNVALVDYHLPDGSGLDLIKQASNYVRFKCPVILLTGQGDDQIDLNASEAGAADYLEKNELNAISLERSIRYAMRHNSLLRKLKEANKKLSELDRFRSQVFGMAHDEFGDPINRIRNSIKELLVGALNVNQEKQLKIALEECDNLDNYIKQFLRANTVYSG